MPFQRRGASRSLRRMLRQLADFWPQIIAVVAIDALLIASAPVVAIAGDTYPQGGNGDCWRGGTPVMCRTTWTGRNSPIYMRIIDQLSDTSLHNSATSACNNWNVAAGPQYCSWTARTNDTWTYLKRNDSLTAPNGVTWNCISGSCPTPNNAGNILWSVSAPV